jgi:DNA-binding PadR family transcriptional regulator
MMSNGPVYGGQVAHRIAELTEGTWNIGAGALYPTLNKLVEKGWATEKKINRKKLYTITADGIQLLSSIKSGINFTEKKYLFSWRLILDLVDRDHLTEFVLQRCSASLGVVDEILKDKNFSLSASEKEFLAKEMAHQLDGALNRLKRYNVLEAA